MHLEPFCYCTKLAAKRAKLVQLMQKFRPRCLVKFFYNERSRSTQLDPKIMFLCISFRSGAFWTVSLLHETWCKTSQTGAINAFMPRFRSWIFTMNAPDPHHWTQNSCFGAFLSVRVHFETVSLLHETRCKMGQLGAINARVRATKSHQNFTKRTLPIHTIGP